MGKKNQLSQMHSLGFFLTPRQVTSCHYVELPTPKQLIDQCSTMQLIDQCLIEAHLPMNRKKLALCFSHLHPALK